jgi:hypothetical protein
VPFYGFMAQPPGPSGWPQPAQGLGGAEAVDTTAVEKTDSSFSSAVDWHWGHCGTVSERTRASKVAWQSVQAYS